jgi:peptidoglycan hydrolase-like protein with peptidoglycan-binding domain
MPLQSRLFNADQKLQACLVNDAAHVTPGAQGDHVSKIQKAIDALGDKVIDANEVSTKTYGPSTAAAVLAYKKKRNIINSSYQTQADNIVGKMTIATLDREMSRVEQPPLIAGSSCGWKQKKQV